MRSRNFLFARWACAFIALAALSSLTASASAGITTITGTTISYSNVSGASVDYTDIKETPQRWTSSSTAASIPVFGQPSGGDALTFNKLSFSVSASGSGSFDVADSKLSMTVSADAADGLAKLVFSEFGDYSLVRAVSASSPSVSYAATGWVTITEISVNGTAVSGLGISVAGTSGLTFSQENITLATGDNMDIGKSWSGTLSFDLAGALAAAGYKNAVVTEAELVLDNTLSAIADEYSVAYIAKKGVTLSGLTVNSSQNVPEPLTSAAILLSLVAFGAYAQRRK